MNRQNFNQTGGFPLKTERLDDMQTAYSIFNQLGYIAGDKTIITGCNESGINTTSGYVFIGGELFLLEGGATLNYVKVVEVKTAKEFENGENKDVTIERKVVFTSNAFGAYLWSSFTRVDPIAQLQQRILPAGTNPQLYCGSLLSIPAGWQLCDGSNGTPDLRSRFIVGYNPNDADYNAIGKTGGAKTVTLTEAQMPSHTHTGTTNSAGAHVHNGLTIKGSSRDNGDPGAYIITANAEANGNQSNDATTGSAGAHSHTIDLDETGGGQAHENRPPYYTLAYIIYKGI